MNALIYIAKRPCGKVSAMSWDDQEAEKEVKKLITRWKARGDTVDRVNADDIDYFLPICRSGCDDCKGQK